MTLAPTWDELQSMDELERVGEASFRRNLPGALPLATLDLSALADIRAATKEFAIERIAPLAEVTLFTGAGSTGKSLLGQQFATAAAAGLPCLGLDVQAGPAIYLTCEDDAEQLHWRQQHICEAMSVDMASLAGLLHLVSLRGALDNELGTFASDGIFAPSEAYNRVSEMTKATGAKLIFLDNVAHLFTGNENDRGEVTRFINLLNRLSGETGAAIILLGHPNKKEDAYSGSTAWLNAVRSQITIERVEDGADPDARVLTVGKANYTRNGEAVRFRWHNWAFIRDEDLPANTRAELAQVIKANEENSAFLKCLAAATERRTAVSENPGTNFFATVFCRMTEGKKLNPEAYKRAFERLLHLGKIELDAKLWQRENRVWKYGIKAVDNCTDPPTPTPCTDPHAPLGQVIEIACTDPHAPTPLISKDINGQAMGQPAHDLDSEDWGQL